MDGKLSVEDRHYKGKALERVKFDSLEYGFLGLHVDNQNERNG